MNLQNPSDCVGEHNTIPKTQGISFEIVNLSSLRFRTTEQMPTKLDLKYSCKGN